VYGVVDESKKNPSSVDRKPLFASTPSYLGIVVPDTVDKRIPFVNGTVQEDKVVSLMEVEKGRSRSPLHVLAAAAAC